MTSSTVRIGRLGVLEHQLLLLLLLLLLSLLLLLRLLPLLVVLFGRDILLAVLLISISNCVQRQV
jgi:hypothetical protein